MDKTNNKYLKNGVHYVGQSTASKNIHCNAYLLVENDEVVLFEPGSVIDFEDVMKNVTDIVAIEDIDYVFASHPDPDLVSSIPLFEKAGLNAKIICDWKTFEILYFYGIKSEAYLVNENKYQLKFKTGRILKFIPAPFAHYSGNIIAYDELYNTLFSGDLFGGYSKDWTLYAGEDYNTAMATYHENYMPSSDFIKPVMRNLLKLKITTILPQHGSIIQGDLVRKSILFLYRLNFYNSTVYVNEVVNNRRDYNFVSILNQMISRLKNVFTDDEILEVFEDTTIEIDPISFEIISAHEEKYQLWNSFFNTIYIKGGSQWLSILETLVDKITRMYNIKKPKIYDSEMATIQTEIYEMQAEKVNMMRKIDELYQIQNKQEDKLNRCSITNLRYTSSLRKLLKKDLQDEVIVNDDLGLIHVMVDDLELINNKYSSETGNETLRIVALKIQELIGNKTLVFRHTGPSFYIYFPNTSYENVRNMATKIRNEIGQSNSFIDEVTVSVSILDFKETVSINMEDRVDEVFAILNRRMESALKYGGGHIVDHAVEIKSFGGHILLIDEDDINRNILLRVFSQINYEVIIAKDVYEVFNILELNKVDVIISEINLSKMDGFALKRSLNMDDKFAQIPFIMLSHNKNHDTVRKANQLDVDFIVKKPFYPEEIVGLVERIEKRAKNNV